MPRKPRTKPIRGTILMPLPVRRPMVCEACDKGNHDACANPQSCVCAFRGHR